MIEGRAPDAIRFEWVRVVEERAHVGTNGRQVGAASRFSDAVIRSQARDALVGLGWKIAIASAAVQEAYAHVGAGATIDVLIREALRRCPKPTSSS